MRTRKEKPMSVTIESRVPQMQVFNLPHEAYCGHGDCGCSDMTFVVTDENPRTGERAGRLVMRKTPASLTLLAKERRAGLPIAILEVPEVKAAIRRGWVRIVEQTPDQAAPPPAPPPPPPPTPPKQPAAPSPAGREK
jgi:hypothetical protein